MGEERHGQLQALRGTSWLYQHKHSRRDQDDDMHNRTGVMPHVCAAVPVILKDDHRASRLSLLQNGDEFFDLTAPQSMFTDFNFAFDVRPQRMKRQTDEQDETDLIVITKHMEEYMVLDMFMDGNNAHFDTDNGGYNNFGDLSVENHDDGTVTISFTREKTDHLDVYLQGYNWVTLVKVNKTTNESEELDSKEVHLTDRFDEMNELFPTNAQGLCNNRWVMGEILDVLCLKDDYYHPNATEQDMCFAEWRSLLCYKKILDNLGVECTDDSIRGISVQEDFRRQYFNRTQSYCESNLTCEMSLLTYGEEIGHYCLPSVTNLLHSPLEGILSAVTMDGSELLSCNVWSQAFWCAYSVMESHNVSMTSCDATKNLQPALVALTLIATEDREPVPRMGARHYEQCDPIQFPRPTSGCPEDDNLLYLTVASCGNAVLQTYNSTHSYNGTCSTLGYCMAKIGEAYMPSCDNISDITQDAQANSDYAMFMDEVGVFNPENCTFASMEETLCYGRLHELSGRFPLVRQYDFLNKFGDMLDAEERCSVLSALNRHYGDFLYDEADECESFVGHFVEYQLEQLWSDYDKKNWSRCNGDESPCSNSGLVAFMMCYHHIADGNEEGCTFKECLAKSPVIRQCNITGNITGEDIQEVFHQLDVPSPPKCTVEVGMACMMSDECGPGAVCEGDEHRERRADHANNTTTNNTATNHTGMMCRCDEDYYDNNGWMMGGECKERSCSMLDMYPGSYQPNATEENLNEKCRDFLAEGVRLYKAIGFLDLRYIKQCALDSFAVMEMPVEDIQFFNMCDIMFYDMYEGWLVVNRTDFQWSEELLNPGSDYYQHIRNEMEAIVMEHEENEEEHVPQGSFLLITEARDAMPGVGFDVMLLVPKTNEDGADQIAEEIAGRLNELDSIRDAIFGLVHPPQTSDGA